jgi:hypothetical protein
MPRTRSIAVLGMLVLISAQGVRDKRTAAGPAAYMIEINGVGTAMVSAVAGGYVTGDVVTAAAGPGAPPQKNIGSVHVVPVTIEVAPGDLTAWIQESLKGTAQPVSGRILEMDVDASSKEPARVKLTFQPRQITSKKGDGSKATVAGGPKDTKRATGSAFRVTIPGVDCSGVSRVEPVTFKYKPAENAAAEARAPKSQAGTATAGDLVLSVAESKAADFAQWATEFLIEGNNGDDREKTVTVELLSPDMKSTILAIEGHGVGIYALKPPGSGADATRRAEAQMYVERWQLK